MKPAFETLSEEEWSAVDRARDLLDDGELEQARIQTDSLLERRPRHPDLLVLDASVALEEGAPQRALEALHGAETSADPAFFFQLRAVAHYELGQMDPAREDALRSIAIRPRLPEAHALLAKVYEFQGEDELAARHSEEAESLDPEAFPAPLEVPEEEFDRLVEQSLQELPEPVRRHLREIPVLVEDLPSLEVLAGDSPPLPPDILGLFVGRHRMERRHDDPPDSPGVIYLFRRNLLRSCRDPKQLAEEVRITVQHEVGHYLGLDEDELEEWGLG